MTKKERRRRRQRQSGRKKALAVEKQQTVQINRYRNKREQKNYSQEWPIPIEYLSVTSIKNRIKTNLSVQILFFSVDCACTSVSCNPPKHHCFTIIVVAGIGVAVVVVVDVIACVSMLVCVCMCVMLRVERRLSHFNSVGCITNNITCSSFFAYFL